MEKVNNGKLECPKCGNFRRKPQFEICFMCELGEYYKGISTQKQTLEPTHRLTDGYASVQLHPEFSNEKEILDLIMDCHEKRRVVQLRDNGGMVVKEWIAGNMSALGIYKNFHKELMKLIS